MDSQSYFGPKFGCDKFDPKFIWSPDIRSPTFGPQLIGPSGQTVPNQFGPPGQMVSRICRLSRGRGSGDPKIWGPNWLGIICPNGMKFWGTICPDWIWLGTFVQWNRFSGDRLSRGTGTLGIKLVQDQMRCSPTFCFLGPRQLVLNSRWSLLWVCVLLNFTKKKLSCTLHTVSLQIFCSLSFPIIFHLQVSALHTFFVKIQHSYLYFNHLTIFTSFKIAKWSRLFHKNHQLLSMAPKCVEVYLGLCFNF